MDRNATHCGNVLATIILIGDICRLGAGTFSIAECSSYAPPEIQSASLLVSEFLPRP